MVVYSKEERNIYQIFTSPGTTVQCELLGWTQTQKEGHSIYNYATRAHAPYTLSECEFYFPP